MVVGVLRLDLYFPESHSLKDKRQGLRRIKDRVGAKFNAGIAEVGDLESWQRASLGVVVVGNAEGHAQSMLDKIADFVEGLYVAQLLGRDHEILHYSDKGWPDEVGGAL